MRRLVVRVLVIHGTSAAWVGTDDTDCTVFVCVRAAASLTFLAIIMPVAGLASPSCPRASASIHCPNVRKLSANRVPCGISDTSGLGDE